MRRLFAVTPADVKRVANQYLTASRVRLDVNPGPRGTPARGSRSTAGVQAAAGQPELRRDRGHVRPLGDARGRPDAPRSPRRRWCGGRLSNGLEVLIAERHELPILTFDLVVKGGETLVPAGKEGLAH